MRAAWLVLALWLAAPSWGQSAAASGATGAVFQADFSNPGLIPAHWTLTLHRDGSGHFRSVRGNAPAGDDPGIQAPDVDRDLDVSAEFATRVFETALRHNFFNEDCESHVKVAFQGLKKLSYNGPEGQGSCEFNYTKVNEIQSLSDSLIAVVGMILEGARLETLLKHDPLGLDQEMNYLVQAARDGRLQQLRTIRSILEQLADDPTVMERVRKRAKQLLQKSEN
jgi:hypothetical protein